MNYLSDKETAEDRIGKLESALARIIIERDTFKPQVEMLRRLLITTSEIVRIQNGNLHADINRILKNCTEALESTDPNKQP